MAKSKRKHTGRKVLPLWGYALVHAAALLFLTGLYWASVQYGVFATFTSTGVLPILALAYLAFVIVTVYELVIDRIESTPRPPAPPEPPAGGLSREGTRRPEG